MISIMKQGIIDGAFWICAYLGLYKGISGFESALIFALWALTILFWISSFGVAVLDDDAKERIAQDSNNKPAWLSTYGSASTWVEAAVLFAFGFHWLAALYLSGAILVRGAIDSIKREYYGHSERF